MYAQFNCADQLSIPMPLVSLLGRSSDRPPLGDGLDNLLKPGVLVNSGQQWIALKPVNTLITIPYGSIQPFKRLCGLSYYAEQFYCIKRSQGIGSGKREAGHRRRMRTGSCSALQSSK